MKKEPFEGITPHTLHIASPIAPLVIVQILASDLLIVVVKFFVQGQ